MMMGGDLISKKESSFGNYISQIEKEQRLVKDDDDIVFVEKEEFGYPDPEDRKREIPAQKVVKPQKLQPKSFEESKSKLKLPSEKPERDRPAKRYRDQRASFAKQEPSADFKKREQAVLQEKKEPEPTQLRPAKKLK